MGGNKALGKREWGGNEATGRERERESGVMGDGERGKEQEKEVIWKSFDDDEVIA